MRPDGFMYYIVCVDYMDFHNLVLTFLYGMKWPLCGTCAGQNQGLERPRANNLDVVGMGVTK